MLSSGADRFAFHNFKVTEDQRHAIIETIANDVVELLLSSVDDDVKARHEAAVNAILPLAEFELDQASEDDHPLEWWPLRPHLQMLYPVAQMLFVIPAPSGRNERALSSAGYLLDPRRTRLCLQSFRSENRVRQSLVEDTSVHDSCELKGRSDSTSCMQTFLPRFFKPTYFIDKSKSGSMSC